jgi:hypothetical protein
VAGAAQQLLRVVAAAGGWTLKQKMTCQMVLLITAWRWMRRGSLSTGLSCLERTLQQQQQQQQQVQQQTAAVLHLQEQQQQ